jgi:DNA-3-methyladenine glycosylase
MSLPLLDDLLAGSAVRAAPRLIGWRMRVGGREAVIAETEAYQGRSDRACHASKGRTARSEVLFHRPGTLYVYLCYGMHWMLNLVCDREGVPAAVLVRGVLIAGVDARLSNGPGKVTARLGIDRRLHGRHLDDGGLELLPPAGRVGPLERGPRVGVAYAGPVWEARPWRWWLTGFPAAARDLRRRPSR